MTGCPPGAGVLPLTGPGVAGRANNPNPSKASAANTVPVQIAPLSPKMPTTTPPSKEPPPIDPWNTAGYSAEPDHRSWRSAVNTQVCMATVMAPYARPHTPSVTTAAGRQAPTTGITAVATANVAAMPTTVAFRRRLRGRTTPKLPMRPPMPNTSSRTLITRGPAWSDLASNGVMNV